MADYYLISQLPSLDGISDQAPLPITEERFWELCGRLLKKKAVETLQALTLTPGKLPADSGSTLVDTWNEQERNLRFALGKVRAEKLKKNFDTENRILLPEHLKAAATAVELENPMEAERYLNRYRLELLESLRPMDAFSEDYLFYYGLKLKLLLRVRQYDSVSGEAAYKSIYNSILNGEQLEAKE